MYVDPSRLKVGALAIASEKVAVTVTKSEAPKVLSKSVSDKITVGGVVSVAKVKLVLLESG